MSTSKATCAAEVWSNDRWPRPYPCNRRGKVDRDGKWWCGTHDPEAVKARRAKSDARIHASMAANSKRYALQAALPALYAACEAVDAWAAEHSDVYVQPIEQVRAALARARGDGR